MPNIPKGEVRWTEHSAVAFLAVFGFFGCQDGIVKTWKDGGAD